MTLSQISNFVGWDVFSSHPTYLDGFIYPSMGYVSYFPYSHEYGREYPQKHLDSGSQQPSTLGDLDPS